MATSRADESGKGRTRRTSKAPRAKGGRQSKAALVKALEKRIEELHGDGRAYREKIVDLTRTIENQRGILEAILEGILAGMKARSASA